MYTEKNYVGYKIAYSNGDLNAPYFSCLKFFESADEAIKEFGSDVFDITNDYAVEWFKEIADEDDLKDFYKNTGGTTMKLVKVYN